MKFGIREITNVMMKAKSAMRLGNKVYYKDEPVLYFDSLKTSSLEGATTTVYAQGGRGNSRLVAWEGEKTLTFNMEDALLSTESFAVLSGAGLIENKKLNLNTSNYHFHTFTENDNYFEVTEDQLGEDFDIAEADTNANVYAWEDTKITARAILQKTQTTEFVFTEEMMKTFNESLYCVVQSISNRYDPENLQYPDSIIVTVKVRGNTWSEEMLDAYNSFRDGQEPYIDIIFTSVDNSAYEKQFNITGYEHVIEKVEIKKEAEMIDGDEVGDFIYSFSTLKPVKAGSRIYLQKVGNFMKGGFIVNSDLEEPTRIDFKYRLSNTISDFDGLAIADYYTPIYNKTVKQLTIDPDKFGGNFYLEADTLFRDTYGADHAATFIIPNCKVQSNFTMTMASSGDPSTFNFVLDAFPGYTRFDPSKKVLAALQINEKSIYEEDLEDRAGTPWAPGAELYN